MDKLDKELYTKQAKRMASIINAASPFAKYLTRPDFINILKLQLNVLYALEKKFSDVKLGDEFKASKLASDFANLSKTDFKLDEAFKYDDDADYIDAFNYLHTYCKNIYKVDIDELAEGKKVEVAAPDINLGADAKADVGGNPYMGAAMGAMAGMEGLEGMNNPFAYAQASNKLNEEIRAGKVYQFKSKPKAIPTIKLVLTIMTLVLTFAFLLTSVFVFLSNGLAFNYEGSTKNANFITNGIFYIITGGFACYVGVSNLIQLIKSKNNDNNRYSFTWFIYFGLILLVFMIPLIDLRSTWIISVEITDTTFRKTVGFAGWKVLLLIDIALGALMLIPMIIGAVKAPKVDVERMQSILQQYMSEYVPSHQQYTKPEGADVQKPVDVKPSEEKKDEKKPDEPLKS